MINIQEEIKRCCSTTCDREAVIESMRNLYSVVVMDCVSMTLHETEGPYSKCQAQKRARYLTEQQLKNSKNDYEIRKDLDGSFIFTGTNGIDVLKIFCVHLIPNGTTA